MWKRLSLRSRLFLPLCLMFLAALLFGASTVLATQLGAIALPTQVVYMLPPFITICALVFAGRRTNSQEKFSA